MPIDNVFDPEMVCFCLLNDGQGENVDALVYYVGENPIHCPFEQGLEQQVSSSFLKYIVVHFNYVSNNNVECSITAVTADLLNFVRLFKKAHEENVKQAELEKKEAAEDKKLKKGKGLSLTRKVVDYS